MGYGGKEALLTHTGRPGDAGLDGIIRQDALGLDQVGVQAKRYDRESAVQRPEMQAFAGALQGAQTTRGVFVTTGRFSSGARQFADQVAMRLVLIDGTELTRLMVRSDVGVAVRETRLLRKIRAAGWQSTANQYSNLFAQHRPYTTETGPELHQRPALTSMPLVHTEEVNGSIPVSPTRSAAGSDSRNRPF
jgi:hypothetical protein